MVRQEGRSWLVRGWHSAENGSRSLRAGKAFKFTDTRAAATAAHSFALACSSCARLHSPFSSVTPSDELINTAINFGTLWLNAVDREGDAWGEGGGQGGCSDAGREGKRGKMGRE